MRTFWKEKISFKVPKEIKTEFWEQAEQNAWKVLNFLSVSTIFLELLNIYRVLVVSSKKLGTLNNRIYFSFYCVLLFDCTLFVLVSFLFRKKLGKKVVWLLHRSFYFMWLAWGLLLNYYELVSRPNQNLSVAVTCIMGTAVCMQGTLAEAFLLYGIGALTFMIAAYPIIGMGGCINVMIAVMLACLASVTKFVYKVDNLKSKKRVDDMNKILEEKNRELYVGLQKYQFAFEWMDNIMFDWDMQHGEIIFSRKWQEKFGYETKISNIPKWFSEITFLNQSEKKKVLRGINDSIQNRNFFEMEILVGNQLERQEWYLLRFHPQFEPDGSVKSGIGFLTNIQKQREEMDVIQTKMRQDYLTGTLNREGLQEIVKAQFEKNNGRMAMFQVDLDDFKKINDTYGHPCGDAVLIEASKVFTRVFKSSGYVGRTGGDEFMIVCPNPGDMEVLKRMIKDFIKTGISVTWQDSEIQVHFSIGGVVSKKGDTYTSLYQKADYALYRAKEQGKNQYYIEETREEEET